MIAVKAPRRLEQVPLDELRPHPDNPRTHKPKELRKSFDRFGFTNPIFVDERTGFIAAGHGRYELLLAMRKDGAPAPAGVSAEWAVPVVRGWASRNDEEAMAYLIADNRQTEVGGWQDDVLAQMLQSISETELGMEGIGFAPVDLEALLAPLAEDDSIGASQEGDYADRAANYKNKQVRAFFFDYPVDDYEFVVTAAEKARATYAQPSNAELFLAMLKEFDTQHPAP